MDAADAADRPAASRPGAPQSAKPIGEQRRHVVGGHRRGHAAAARAPPPGHAPPITGSGSSPAYLDRRPGDAPARAWCWASTRSCGPLGSGGMGAVYEAVHTGIGKPVALKTMSAALATDPRAEQRFLREAAAASRLEHPHVVDVTDFGSDSGVIYLVMELMRGEDLAALIAARARRPGRQPSSPT